jgi:hypothetical protein
VIAANAQRFDLAKLLQLGNHIVPKLLERLVNLCLRLLQRKVITELFEARPVVHGGEEESVG